MKPFVSICIPAYKRPDFLIRLLDSINIQTFKDFEVIVTDDSSDDSVSSLLRRYENTFNVRYYKNSRPLGTPANWNAAIGLSKGEWIKLMHDDDWFADQKSLEEFVLASKQTNNTFLFSGYKNIHIQSQITEEYTLTAWHAYLLKSNSYNLLKKNFIGHPSTTFIKNDLHDWYDEKLKWVVDIEFYTRTLSNRKFYAIRKPLVNLGISSEQVTKTAFRNPEIEIPENLYLLQKISAAALKAIFAFDYFWRFVRNLSIRDTNTIARYQTGVPVPSVIKLMLYYQKTLPPALLKIGLISKLWMTIAYLHSRIGGLLKK